LSVACAPDEFAALHRDKCVFICDWKIFRARGRISS